MKQGELIGRFGESFKELADFTAKFRTLLTFIPYSEWESSDKVLQSKQFIKDFCRRFDVGAAFRLTLTDDGPYIMTFFYPLKTAEIVGGTDDRWREMLQDLNSKYSN
ncbi:MAG: hypothetical protein HYT12_03445 [Candidatus Liptonbacteria bacterium]|nr:hypothetical protein [Candidatus Liptonbacteria bacterium]